VKSYLREHLPPPSPEAEEYISSQLELEPFDKMQYDFLVAQDDHVPSSELFVSAIGMCPRKLLLQKSGTEIEATPQSQWNKQRMFCQANNVADDLAEMLFYHGRLIAMEQSVSHLMPPRWGGRFDIICLYPGRRFLEVKSSHPNAMRYSETLPKKEHVWQALSYEVWAGLEWQTQYGPLIDNADRGGSNTSRLNEVLMPPDWLNFRSLLAHNITPTDLLIAIEGDPDYRTISEMCKQMITIEDAADAFRRNGDLPPALERACAVRTSKRGTYDNGEDRYIFTEVYMDRDWRCGQCDFCETHYCDPPKGTTAVLSFDESTHEWIVKKNGIPYLAQATDFAHDELHIPILAIKNPTLI
jgi:hypothetical protein